MSVDEDMHLDRDLSSTRKVQLPEHSLHPRREFLVLMLSKMYPFSQMTPETGVTSVR